MSRAESTPLNVSLRSVSKHYDKGAGPIHVLQDLSLEIKAGDSLSIVGASGVGKSTLLHLLGTLDRPSSGELLFNGTDVFSLDDQALAQFRNRHIGYVFQFHHLLPGFSAVENVMIPAIIGGHRMQDARSLAAAALEQVGLAHRLDHQPGELSGGEQQRVAIARAIVLEPRLLLADEPSGNLDVRTGEDIHELLLRLNADRGISLVVVTHNLQLAGRLSRRLRLIDRRLLEDEWTRGGMGA